MRNRARNLLKCHRVNDKLWLIWGGEANHNVKVNDDIFSCDCGPFTNGQVDLCSHIIKVKMEMGIFPSRKS